MGKLQERPLSITDHLPSLLTDEDIEKPSVDMISLRPKDTKYSNQGTNYRRCHKPGLRAIEGFPGGSDGKESVCNVGDPDLIPGLGRCPGKGNGNPLQYCCLENSMDRRGWWAMVHGITNNWAQLSD